MSSHTGWEYCIIYLILSETARKKKIQNLSLLLRSPRPLLLHPHFPVPSSHSSPGVNALLFLWSKVLAGVELAYYPPRLPKTEGRKGVKGVQRRFRCGSFQVRALTSQQQTPSLHSQLSFLSPAPGTTAELLRACRSICTGAVQTHTRVHTHARRHSSRLLCLS